MKHFKKLFRHDVKYGIVRNWLFLLAPVCVLLVYRQCRALLWVYDAEETWSVYLMYLFRGMQIGSPSGRIPVLWALMLLLSLFITLFHPFRDMEGYGSHLLIRSDKRRTWWLSKCAWNLSSAGIYFLFLYGTTTIYCLARGISITLEAPWQSMFVLFMEADIEISGLQVLTLGQTVFVLLLLPFLTVAALCMLEMFLSLLLGPVYALLSCMAIVAASMFSTSPVLFTNYANLTRCGAFIYDGLNGYVGLVICMAVLIGSVVGGVLIFQKRDILPANQKEF